MKKRSKLKVSQGKAGDISPLVDKAKKAKHKATERKSKKGNGTKSFYLRNACDVRQFLSRVASELYYGQLTAQTAGRLAYISNIILKSIEVGDLTKRLEAIEKLVNDKIQN